MQTDRRAGILIACVCLMACTAPKTSDPEPVYLTWDPLKAVYEVGNERFHGVGDKDHGPAAPGSAARNRTSVSGRTVEGDLDGDGNDDMLFWLVHQPGGSGSFYYLAAALKRPEGYQGTRAIFLGDRILPQSLAIKNGVVIAGYADRHAGEPMAQPPTQSRSAFFVLEDSGLVAVASANPGGQILRR